METQITTLLCLALHVKAILRLIENPLVTTRNHLADLSHRNATKTSYDDLHLGFKEYQHRRHALRHTHKTMSCTLTPSLIYHLILLGLLETISHIRPIALWLNQLGRPATRVWGNPTPVARIGRDMEVVYAEILNCDLTLCRNTCRSHLEPHRESSCNYSKPSRTFVPASHYWDQL